MAIKTGEVQNTVNAMKFYKFTFGIVAFSLFLGPVQADVIRPKLIQEQFYSNSVLDKQTQSPLWAEVLAGMGIVSNADSDIMSNLGECSYKQALATLQDIQAQLGKMAPYAKIWALNQNKVFSACNNLGGEVGLPVIPEGANLPARAQSDFQYQLASWYFYKHQYNDALPLYQQVSLDISAPERPNAAYMVARTLAYLGRTADAYHEIGKILSDDSLKKVHRIAINYRFVIMNNTTYIPSKITPDLAKEHLLWLLSMIQANPAGALDSDQALKDYSDAKEQLSAFFPLYDKDDHVVDWWLDPAFDSPSSPRMEAVKTLAIQNDIVDWMQAKWAFNVFDRDWLWALHDPQNEYWQQNHHIVVHALDKWNKTQNGAWLQIAIQRVHPQDELAPSLLTAASSYLTQDWKHETVEYRKWLFTLWQHSLRIQLGRKDYSAALQLISDHADFVNLWPRTNYDWTQRDHPSTLEQTLRWLVYVGKTDEARQFLTAILKQYPAMFRQWQSLLATNQTEALAPAIRSNFYNVYGNTGNGQEIWQDMVNDLPMKTLYELATNSKVDANIQALIARTLLTRAILLHANNATIDKYAALVAKLNPDLRESVLQGISPHTNIAYVGFLLKMPRFRPLPYLNYAETRGEINSGSQSKQLAPTAIDVYNHNDNNWWCRFNDSELRERVLKSVLITPTVNDVLTLKPGEDVKSASAFEETLSPDLKPYVDNQKKLLAQHPYRGLVDEKEILSLEAISSGPEYLSNFVNNREKATVRRKSMSDSEKNTRAEYLYDAVRTTRYGCNRDGSHAAYSRESFELIHKYYNDTSWATATPYWFE